MTPFIKAVLVITVPLAPLNYWYMWVPVVAVSLGLHLLRSFDWWLAWVLLKLIGSDKRVEEL